MKRVRRFAVGDPQAPLSRLQALLGHHGLLGPDGSLAEDVFLISVGDHFDYGAVEQRREAAAEGLQVLAWLASHPPDQVVLIAGNHDLGRVGELAGFSDDAFEEASDAAAAAYRGGNVDPAAERDVLARWPALPSAEVAARDFAAFNVAQRELVADLLRTQRLRLAYAEGGRLFCHAGVTLNVLESIGLPLGSSPEVIADALNHRLDDAFARWDGGALAVPGVHQPGSAALGEGVGMLYHRPAHPDLEVNRGYAMDGALSRRFDARRIPLGVTQVVGHISDKKCRSLLGPWCDDAAPRPGVIRSLVTDGQTVRYRHGHPGPLDDAQGAIVFIDGGMNRTPAAEYELFAL